MSMHGISQGFITGISGGDIGQGFLSGMVSSAIGSLAGGLNTAIKLKDTASDISTMLFGSASGGLSAKLSGGNFWEGVAIGLTVSGLNHVAHKVSYNKLIRKIDESISEQALNPEDTVISEEYAYLREFTESNKVLSKLLNKANKTFHVLFRDVFDYPKAGYDSYDTKRFVYITKAGKEPTGNSLEIGDASVNHRIVAIYKSAFLSNRGLALAIGSGLKFHGFFNSYNSVLPINLFQAYHNKTKEWHYEYNH